MKNRRAIVFFAFAIVFGIAATFTAQRVLDRRAPSGEQAAIETVDVVVASVDVGMGSALIPNQLGTVEWPAGLVPDGAFTDKSQLEGRVLRRALADGEPVLEHALLPLGAAAGLVSVINDTLRAVSVKVDPIIGVAGFVSPGSRVDVVATLRPAEGRAKMSISKVILQNIPVLAIDQKMEEVKNGEPELVSVVTLEVNPKQAEELTYSAHEGRLQLALRSPSDQEITKTPGASARSILPRQRRKRSGTTYAQTNVQILKGTAVSVKAF